MMSNFLEAWSHWGWLWFGIGVVAWPLLKRIPDGLFFLLMCLEEMFD